MTIRENQCNKYLLQKVEENMGGLVREIEVPIETWEKIESYIEEDELYQSIEMLMNFMMEDNMKIIMEGGRKAMRGNMDGQVNHLFVDSQIFQEGADKHELKEEIRADYESRGEKCGWEELGKELPICSFKTAEAYKDVWHQCAKWGKENFKLNNIEKIDDKIINAFLEHKIKDDDISKSTFQQYAAALSKLEVALDKYAEKNETGKEYNFDLSPSRELGAELPSNKDISRAYDDPSALVGAVSDKDEKFGLIAELQYEGGCRVSEVLSLKEESFKEPGKIELENTKGGLVRTIEVRIETWEKTKAFVEEKGGFYERGAEAMKDVADEYRNCLKESASETGQSYEGSHGLRWSYSQESYQSHMKGDIENGIAPKSPEASCQAVANEIGHHRSDITLHYLQ